MRWELTDMGSLNGTLLNSQPINHSDSGSRQWGEPMELASGDIITLGTTSKIYVSLYPLYLSFKKEQVSYLVVIIAFLLLSQQL